MELRIGDRNPMTGLYDVIWPDGGVTQNGVKIFNSEHQFGDVVLTTQRSDGMIMLDGVKAVEMSSAAAISSATLSSIRTGGDSGHSSGSALFIGGFGLGNGNGSSGSAGYLNGQIFNDEEEAIKTYLKIEVVVFGSPYVVEERFESAGFYPVYADSHLFISGVVPPVGGSNLLPRPPLELPYDSFDGTTLTEVSFQQRPYELTLYGYPVDSNGFGSFSFSPTFFDILLTDFQAGLYPVWWLVFNYSQTPPALLNSQYRGSYTKINEWIRVIKTTIILSPPPLNFGELLFYVENAGTGYWSSLPDFPGKVFPVNSDGIHELQLDPDKFSGNEIIIHCIPVSPPTSATFGLRTETIKRRQPYSFTASSPTLLAATSNTLTEEILSGSPANSKTAFIVNYSKGTRQFA